ncbi:MAG: choice-of-anchor P family protein [Gammaproteobacteria bacterium]
MKTKSMKKINASFALALAMSCGIAQAGKPTKSTTPPATDPTPTSASIAGTVAGEAYSLSVGLNTLDLLRLQLGPVPYVSLFETGGFAEETLLQVDLLDLVNSSTLVNLTAGGIGGSKAGAMSVSAAEHLSLFNGIVKADLLTSVCTSYGTGSTAGSQAGGDLVNLVIGGKAINIDTAPNTKLYVSAGGNLLTSLLGLLTPPPIEIIVNEQISSGDGMRTSGIVRNALHVKVNASLLSLNLASGDVVVSSAKCGVDATTVNVPPSNDAVGFVTGGGQLHKATFGFNARPGKGQLQYIDHNTGRKVHSETVDVDTFQISGDCATFTGVTKDGLDYNVEACDKGEPGTDDTFSLELYNGGVTPIYQNSGVIDHGNIQLHQ